MARAKDGLTQKSQFSLLKTRRFLPLFIVQFLGAFNDNLLKTILVVLIAYGLWDVYGWDAGVLVAVAAGLFVLPFILFCPLAGVMADKFDKADMIRVIKIVEIVIAVLAVAALFSGDLYFAFAVLLLLGAQSAFFSPCKFSILPQHLEEDELVGGNALVSTGTYLAILAGTIVGAIVALMDGGKMIASGIILVMAIVGYLAALRIPTAPAPSPDMRLNYNIFARGVEVFRFALVQKGGVLISILGVSYFYFVAATFHAQFPNFVGQTLGADNIVLSVFMVVFSVGVAIGGLLNHRILKARAHGGLVPVACFFMALFGVDIYFAARAYPSGSPDDLHSLSMFVSNIHGVRLLVATFLQAIACGLFVIPLRAIVQARAEQGARARVISSSNMMDALFILLASILAAILLGRGMMIEELYLTVSVLTFGVGGALLFTKSLRADHPA